MCFMGIQLKCILFEKWMQAMPKENVQQHIWRQVDYAYAYFSTAIGSQKKKSNWQSLQRFKRFAESATYNIGLGGSS